ncbi:hypothetical protein TTHERM_00137810 (macronuclear) [Tetrahymena thermophila SB210]|uniref:Uncharacterized protein n=1 Tax=Tetrahymena thermophila (strain SB210) TaxID=312017 RepID=I7M8R4_TETTS|nr:hypothetical protein TTHERM_00137810 [Tetrahymena thermophila SB210]EAR99518.2 hypothetical protein TTHERM_00137810 [Tetrahymena thermophila SB210]|eukprot:XP_001019763.2 hypothetical protein TTHERM_00137810 [Tetrahymena thermophila SB210]
MEQENGNLQQIEDMREGQSNSFEEQQDSQFEESEHKLPEPEIINFHTQDLEKEIQLLQQNDNQNNYQTNEQKQNDIQQPDSKNQRQIEDSMASFMSSLPQLVGPHNQYKEQRNLIDQHWLLNSQQQNESAWQSSINSFLSIGQSKMGNGGIINKFTQSLIQNQQNGGNPQLKDIASNLIHQQSMFQDSGQLDQFINMFAQANQQFQVGNKLTSKNSFKQDISQNSQLQYEDVMNQKVKNNLNNLGLDVISEIQSIKNPIGTNNILSEIKDSRFSQDVSSEVFVTNKNNQNVFSHFRNFCKNENSLTLIRNSSNFDNKLNDQISPQSNLKLSNNSQLSSLKSLTNSHKVVGQNSQKNVQKQKLFNFFEQVPKAISEKIEQKNQLFKDKMLEKQNSIGSQFRKIFHKLIDKNKDQNDSSLSKVQNSYGQKKQDACSNNNGIIYSNRQSSKNTQNVNKIQEQKQFQLPTINIKSINTINSQVLPIQSQVLTQTGSTKSIKQQKKGDNLIQASQKISDQQDQLKTNQQQQSESNILKVNLLSVNQKISLNNSADFLLDSYSSQTKNQQNDQNKQKNYLDIDQFGSQTNAQSEAKHSILSQSKQTIQNFNSNRKRNSFNLEFQQSDCQRENNQNYQIFLKNQENEEFNLSNTQINLKLFNTNLKKLKYRSNTQNKDRNKDHLPELTNSKYYSLAQEKRAERKQKNIMNYDQPNIMKKLIKIRTNKQDNNNIQNSTIISNLNNSLIAAKKINLEQNNYKLENLLSEHIHLKEFDDSIMQDPNSYSHQRINKFANQNLLTGVPNQRNLLYQSISPILNTNKKLSPQTQTNSKVIKISIQQNLPEEYSKNQLQSQNLNMNYLQSKDISFRQEQNKKTKKRKIVNSLQIPVQNQQLQSFYFQQQPHLGQFQSQYVKHNNLGHSQIRSQSNQQSDMPQQNNVMHTILNTQTSISAPDVFMVKKANIYNRQNN